MSDDISAPEPDPSVGSPLWSVADRVCHYAATTPDVVAVTDARSSLTFAELAARAGAVAMRLVECGVAPGAVVAVWCTRTVEAVVGIMGTLVAGASYTPVDPAHPAARQRAIVAGARASVLLSAEPVPDAVRGDTAVVALDPGGFGPGRDVRSDVGESRPMPVGPDAAAYVMFTSGSTGAPKGVVVTHRGLHNYLTWAGYAYQVTRGQGAPVHSSLAFDLSITSLLLPLVYGRRVDLLPEERGVAGLVRALQSGVDYSLVKLTPAHLTLLSFELASMGRSRSLGHSDWRGHLVVGGEQLYADMLAPWCRYAPLSTVTNEYGPTETVVGCTFWQRPAAAIAGEGPVPIGVPIDNAEILLLDAALRPVPQGTPGEIYVAGPMVARGYLHAPSQTATRFLPHPTRASGRMYRTGDNAVRAADGDLVYLGRGDNQVKVAGHRVELAGIEAVIRSHPAISDVAVVAQRDPAPALVAYVVPHVLHNGTAHLHRDPVAGPLLHPTPPTRRPSEADLRWCLAGVPVGLPSQPGVAIIDLNDHDGAITMEWLRRWPTTPVICGRVGYDSVGSGAASAVARTVAVANLLLGGCASDMDDGHPSPTAHHRVADVFTSRSLRRVLAVSLHLDDARHNEIMAMPAEQLSLIDSLILELPGSTDSIEPARHRLESAGFRCAMRRSASMETVFLRASRAVYATASREEAPPPSIERMTGLRRWLSQRLPAYEIPAVIHLLDRLPVTENGKVDRKALVAGFGPD